MTINIWVITSNHECKNIDSYKQNNKQICSLFYKVHKTLDILAQNKKLIKLSISTTNLLTKTLSPILWQICRYL